MTDETTEDQAPVEEQAPPAPVEDEQVPLEKKEETSELAPPPPPPNAGKYAAEQKEKQDAIKQGVKDNVKKERQRQITVIDPRTGVPHLEYRDL